MNEPTLTSLPVQGLYLVLGLGETGLAAGCWCAHYGVRLRVADTREHPPGLDVLRERAGDAIVDVHCGPQALSAQVLDGVDAVILSPGLSPFESPVADLLAEAAAREIEVVGEIELFARALRDLAATGYQPKVLAVTGTNGKTTVTAMARQLVQAHGLSAVAAGNISPAALDALAEALRTNALPDVWVLELSSFQLHTLKSLVADAATVLNVTQDHLDWHGSMQAYAAAKASLLSMAKCAIINRDDPVVAAMVPRIEATHVCSFGKGLPELEGDLGLYADHDVTWLAASESLDFDREPVKQARGRRQAELLRTPGRLSPLMPVDAMRVRGMHNALNALAALALVRSIGLGWAESLNALRNYVGQPHRTEFVRTVGGVDFVNDSKGTNVGAAVAALEGMGAKVVLIAGGLGKGQDFSPLCTAVRHHARAVVLIGRDALVLETRLKDAGVALLHARSLDEAVNTAFEQARQGDVVLLSPACASMDMFRNYGHRGDAFVQAVQELALQQGEVI
ncbi:MAG: UDP-N-acetylmuramoyl-L-alanine--D-glutamate ligase [Burkholderiaceae bacterium]|jgi:UDP-N-acetylmuramoylalanine--D-glutamate ligase